jgi:hypothetical protein
MQTIAQFSHNFASNVTLLIAKVFNVSLLAFVPCGDLILNYSSYKSLDQGVTKKCRLSWLTKSTLVYEPKCGGLNQWVQLYTGAQINFVDLAPYLIYALTLIEQARLISRSGGFWCHLSYHVSREATGLDPGQDR